MWELGYAMARDRHPILLTRQGQSLPFDLHDMHQIPYDRNRLVQTLERPPADSLRDSVEMLEQRARGPSKLEQLEREVQRLHAIIGSGAYARMVGESLAVVYCYEGNNELSGVYYDWRLQGDWIFGRYAWRKEPITGFSFLKAESDSLLMGNWWYTGDADGNAELPPSHQNGWRAELERLSDTPTPSWAEEGFSAIERVGVSKLLESWGH